MKIFDFKEVVFKIPKLLIKGQFDFKFELLPYRAENIGFKKAANFFLGGLNQYLLPSRPLGYPVIAQVEPANFCNLTCPLCLTTSITQARPKSLLSLKTFTRFIDECGDYLLLLIFWNWGEPFLNPDLIKMISYAKAKGIVVHTSTNGNVLLNGGQIEALVDSGLDSLVVAVDGATQQTYEQYRSGGNLKRVLENIENIIRIRTAKGSATPRINMRLVVMRHNEGEVEMAHDLAKRLGVDYFTLKTVNLPVERGGDLDEAYTPERADYQRYEYHKDTFKRKKRPFVCMRPWKRITLDSSGAVLACEYDYTNEYSFGNINDSGVLSAWKSALSRKYRADFNLGYNSSYFCRNCNYKNSISDECTIHRVAIEGSISDR